MHDAAGPQDAADRRVGLLGHEILVDERAEGDALALDIGLVLDGDRQAFEGARPAVGLHVPGLGLPCLLERALVVLDRKGIDLRFDLLGARNDGLHQLHRRELARLEAAERLRRAQVAEFDIRHDSPSEIVSPAPASIAGPFWHDTHKKVTASGCRSVRTDPTLQ
jgi:hypothetical protein